MDVNGNGAVSMDELIAAVNNALNGCAAPTVTPGSRFTDPGNGTIADSQTGLTWEKKVGLGGGMNAANLHAADNLYNWAGKCSLAAPGVSCQPNAAAAAVCTHGSRGDQSGCARCQEGQGTCTADPNGTGSLMTVWAWIAQLNAGSGFAGHNDWRVPTAAELESIIDYARTDPATDMAFNGGGCGPGCTDARSAACSCTQSECYWSATTSLAQPGDASVVFFGSGTVMPYPFAQNLYVRAVRGGAPAPKPRYVDNGDGTITDRQTSLIWEKKVGSLPGSRPDIHSVGNPYSWAGECLLATDILCQPNSAAAGACSHGTQGDLNGCAQCLGDQGQCELGSDGLVVTTIWDWAAQLNAGSGFAEHNDWRVPTVVELESIIDYAAADPATDMAFSGSCTTGPECTDLTSAACSCTDPDYYWSATISLGGQPPWEVDFGQGNVGFSGRSLRAGRFARAVRGGP
jgi:hypothetical protein